MKKIYKALGASAVVGLILTAGSCDNQQPSADSDSSQSYKDGSKIPVDDNYYVIKGEVVGQVNNLTRQVKPAEGSIGGSSYGNGYSSFSGTFTGPIEAGKGFVRLKIETTSPNAPEAAPGEAVILKTSDTKVTALQPGDIITFKCRRQYEAVAAVRDNSDFDKNKAGTWEFDFCRLETPRLEVK